MSQIPAPPLPLLDDLNRPFWTGGEQGQLRLWQCTACQYHIHPPAPVCPQCLSTRLVANPVSGRATLQTFTVNHQPWVPGQPVPYVIAIVELDEQPGLRLTTRIVGAAPEALQIGQRMQVVFEQHDDVWLPLFTPARD